MSPVAIVLGFLGLFVTIISSGIGVAAFLTSRLTKLETEVKYAFERLTALEEAAPRVVTTARPRRKGK